MPRVKAVLDTNIIVSALLKDSGQEALVFNLAASGMFIPVVSDPLLDEYGEVLGRPGFGFGTRRVQGALQDVRRHALHVGAPPVLAGAAHDPDDDMVLACALAGGADYLVT
ncbi:MAG: putative toxin-antitoxin system toxin component, PIN family, partial [Terriglobales bacterium]